MRRRLGLGQLNDDEVGLRAARERQRGGEVRVEWGSKFFHSVPIVQVVGRCSIWRCFAVSRAERTKGKCCPTGPKYAKWPSKWTMILRVIYLPRKKTNCVKEDKLDYTNDMRKNKLSYSLISLFREQNTKENWLLWDVSGPIEYSWVDLILSRNKKT
jgi:hypothetical protein